MRRIVEVKTLGYQSRRAGYGSSASAGDAYGPFLEVPGFVPISGDRFIFRLVAAAVPAGQRCKVLGYKFLSLIGRSFLVSDETGEQWPYNVDREVVSPMWAFPDGNVIYYLRRVPLRQMIPPSVAFPPSVQYGMDGTDSALLALQYSPTPRIYVPPAGGEPDGDPIAGLDRIYDQPGVWIDVESSNDYVEGPCVIAAYASVRQTDPASRPFLPLASYPVGNLAQGLRPEDQFLLVWGEPPLNNTRYTGVAGALRLEYVNNPRKGDT